jgi:3-oxoacyl-[acyl-carrier protein] reductase
MSIKSVFLTGASRGLGREIKVKLEHEGYKVVSPSRAVLNLSSKESISKYIEKEEQNDFYALIFNAGINYPAKLDMLTPEKFEEMIEVNLVSIIRILNQFLRLNSNLKHIILISSIWSIRGKMGRSVYAASKAGIDALVRNLAVELSDRQILVNSLVLGYMSTEMTYQNNTIDEVNSIISGIPTKRLIETSEISEFISYLLDKNISINGQSIVIDGGYTNK